MQWEIDKEDKYMKKHTKKWNEFDWTWGKHEREKLKMSSSFWEGGMYVVDTADALLRSPLCAHCIYPPVAVDIVC